MHLHPAPARPRARLLRPPHRTLTAGLLLPALLACGKGAGESAAPAGAGPWRQYARAEEAGFSSAGLESARRFADSVQSGGVVAVFRGNVLAAWGDVARELETHSVRKSLYSALYGTLAAEGGLDLDATLGALGVDDVQPLTTEEKGARLRDVISARSGVYLPAAYAPSDQGEGRPSRGSHPPGTHWFYNNWDFNVAGVVLERLLEEDLYHAFDRRIARPLGMEDYDPGDGFRVLEPGNSRHPALTFRLSARDLARFGQLYLQQGRWNGSQVIPPEWVRESTRAHSDLGGGRGYGYMWWTYAAGSLGESYPALTPFDVYAASGTGGQAIIVVPGAELVVVHRGDTDHQRNVSGRDVWAIAERILAARQGEPAARPALVPLAPVPLASQLPPLPRPRVVTIDPAVLDAYVGRYEVAPGAVARVFLHDGRPFMFVPGEGEAELLPLSDGEFTIAVVPGVRVAFERDGEGGVTGVVLTMGPTTIRGARMR